VVVPEQHFLQLLGKNESASPDPHNSQNTNLCFFHYFDKLQSYSQPQKCMVHADHGLLTIVPRSDLPGLEVFNKALSAWIPVEKFIGNDDLLLFCGLAFERVTNSSVPSLTHRVARQPKLERYSMPFEMKPNDDAVLTPFNSEKVDDCKTFDQLTKGEAWAKIMRQVRRSDAIEPGSVEEQAILAEVEERKLEQQLSRSQVLIQPHETELKDKDGIEENVSIPSAVVNGLIGTDMSA